MNEPDPARTAGEDSAYDPTAMAELEDLFGRTRLTELLGALDREIAARLEPPTEDRAQLARDAHALVSSSGAMAFIGLSRASADLEQACLRGVGIEDALDASRGVAAEARAAIAALRSR